MKKPPMIRRLIILLLIVGCEEVLDPDTTAPTVVITYPVNNSTLDSTATIKVDAADDKEISFVQFIIDGDEFYADCCAPYLYEWNVCHANWGGTGTHTVLVKAEDIAGNQGQSDIYTFTLNASYDCESVCGGDNVLDNCGACDADSNNDCPADCNGDYGGTAVLDDCNDCVGGNTELEPNYAKDDCGICDGNNSPNTGTCDCEGTPNGDALKDMCNTCDADESNDCVQDECGVWGGDNSPNTGTCDCAGTPNGDAVEDDCAVGIYTLTTYFSYDTPDCSGQGKDIIEENIEDGVSWSLIIELNTAGISVFSILAGETTISTRTGVWTQNNNNISIILDCYISYDEEEICGASETFTFIDNQLIIYSYGTDGMDDGWIGTSNPCEHMVFTNNQ